jgi:hypothetical protein
MVIYSDIVNILVVSDRLKAVAQNHPVREIGLSWAKHLPSNSANVDKTLARRCP